MTTAAAVYDSDERRKPVVAELRNLWRYRGLLRLLVVRDLTVRYKRSILGVWWTVLNPLLFAGVMWAIFSQIFRFAIPDPVPFIVYLLSGVLLVQFFSQGVGTSGASIVSSSAILTKLYVPPEVFALSAGVAAAVNFMIGVVPLLIIQVALGVGVPWTVVLLPIPVVAMLCFVTGLGLVVAAGAVFFYDVLDLTTVGITLVAYVTPSFWPVSIVPGHLRFLVELNPLYSYLLTFRHFVYLGQIPPWYVLAVMFATALGSLALGVWVFSRTWKNLVVML